MLRDLLRRPLPSSSPPPSPLLCKLPTCRAAVDVRRERRCDNADATLSLALLRRFEETKRKVSAAPSTQQATTAMTTIAAGDSSELFVVLSDVTLFMSGAVLVVPAKGTGAGAGTCATLGCPFVVGALVDGGGDHVCDTTTVGCAVDVVAALGKAVGVSLATGAAVGSTTGCAVGKSDGALLGKRVGAVLGKIVGNVDGAGDGERVGDTVGASTRPSKQNNRNVSLQRRGMEKCATQSASTCVSSPL